MKTKKLEKKITLTKETVSNLNMQEVKGGWKSYYISCDPACDTEVTCAITMCQKCY